MMNKYNKFWNDEFEHFFTLDKCPSVKILDVLLTVFYFEREEMNKMLGTNDWDKRVIKVVYKRSRESGGQIYWAGELKVEINSDAWSGKGTIITGDGGIGSWHWQQDDFIHLSSCVSTGKRINNKQNNIF